MIVAASTQNPLGQRPWNSRLAGYERASFPLPTTDLGFSLGRGRRGRLGMLGQATGAVTPGTMMTYSAQIYQGAGAVFSANTLVTSFASVGAILASENSGIQIQASSTSSFLNLGLGNVQVALNLLVNNNYASVADVQSLVDNAIYQVMGSLPNSSAITSVTSPGGVATATGAPGPVSAALPSTASILPGGSIRSRRLRRAWGFPRVT